MVGGPRTRSGRGTLDRRRRACCCDPVGVSGESPPGVAHGGRGRLFRGPVLRGPVLGRGRLGPKLAGGAALHGAAPGGSVVSLPGPVPGPGRPDRPSVRSGVLRRPAGPRPGAGAGHSWGRQSIARGSAALRHAGRAGRGRTDSAWFRSATGPRWIRRGAVGGP